MTALKENEMVENNICRDHSGCIADITNMKSNIHELWKYTQGVETQMKEMRDSIQSRINYVLGGIVVACILMVVNMVIGK